MKRYRTMTCEGCTHFALRKVACKKLNVFLFFIDAPACRFWEQRYIKGGIRPFDEE